RSRPVRGPCESSSSFLHDRAGRRATRLVNIFCTPRGIRAGGAASANSGTGTGNGLSLAQSSPRPTVAPDSPREYGCTSVLPGYARPMSAVTRLLDAAAAGDPRAAAKLLPLVYD